MTSALYTLATGKIIMGNLTLVSITRLSTMTVIAALVAPVKSCQMVWPVSRYSG